MKKIISFLVLIAILSAFAAGASAEETPSYTLELIAGCWEESTETDGALLYAPCLRFRILDLERGADGIAVRVVFSRDGEDGVWSEETQEVSARCDSLLLASYSAAVTVRSSAGHAEKLGEEQLEDLSAAIYVNDVLCGSAVIEKCYGAQAPDGGETPEADAPRGLKAEDVDLAAMSPEELAKLRDAADALLNPPQAGDAGMAVWTGEGKTRIYEDETVSVDFNGFYQWTNDWYIPNLIITNKTDRSINFEWKDVFLNGCNVGAANKSGSEEILPGGKLSFASAHCCSITLQDFVDIYGDTTIEQVRVSFYVTEAGSYEHLLDGSCGVACAIDIAELMGR